MYNENMNSFGGQTMYKESLGNESFADSLESRYYYGNDNTEKVYDYDNYSQQDVNLNAGYQQNKNDASDQMNYTTNMDVMPSATTMQFNEERDLHDHPFANYKNDENSKYKIPVATKIMIAVYAIVLAVVFTCIAFNSTVMKALSASIKSSELELQTLMTTQQNLNNELEYVSSNEVIEQKALDFGMVKE